MRKWLVAMVLLIGYGCGSPQIVLYDDKYQFPLTSPDQVKIFYEKPRDKEFMELGLVKAINSYSMDSAETWIKKKASTIGADAVYIIQRPTQGQTTPVNLLGIAIKYR
ncbi:MAG: hypothetical protein ABII26_07450 [Pseudomonadota bacterium]